MSVISDRYIRLTLHIAGATVRPADVVFPLLPPGSDGDQGWSVWHQGTVQDHRVLGWCGGDVLQDGGDQSHSGGDHHGAGDRPGHGAGGDGHDEARLQSGLQGGRGRQEGGVTVVDSKYLDLSLI